MYLLLLGFFFCINLQAVIAVTYITNVRFLNGTTDSTKPIEVQKDGEWYYLCTDEDQTRETLVACRQLGYIGGWQRTLQQENATGFTLQCLGDENTLADCEYVDNSDPKECPGVLGLWCYNTSTALLVDNPSKRPNIGRLQVKYDDVLTNVCFEGSSGNDKPWNFTLYNNLEVLCTQLGYPGSLTTSPTTISDTSSSLNVTRYTDDYKCIIGMARVSQLYNCLPDGPSDGYCNNDMYVHAVCAIPGYIGCYSVSTEQSITHDNMTVQRCIRYCRQEGTLHAVLLEGNGCSCKDGIFGVDGKVADSECNTPCVGDPYDICGGAPLDEVKRISVYNVTLRECSDPGAPMNGSVVYNNHENNKTFEFGAILQFKCETGFLLVGNPTLQCVLGNSSDELVWSGSTPMCQELSVPTTPTLIPVQSSSPFFVIPTTTTQAVGMPQRGGVAVGVSVAVILFLIIIILLVICVIIRKRRKQKSTTSLERVYVTVDRNYNVPSSGSASEGISNAYVSTDVNGTEYASPQAVGSATGESRNPKKSHNPAESKAEQSAPLYASVNKDQLNGNQGVGSVSSEPSAKKGQPVGKNKPNHENKPSQPPVQYDYADVSKIIPPGQTTPEANSGNKTPQLGKPTQVAQPYDYADVSKVIPHVRMPPGVDKDPSTPGGNPIGQAKQPSPEYAYADVTKVVPRPRMPPGVEKDQSTPGGNPIGQARQTSPEYDYADVTKVVPHARMPPGIDKDPSITGGIPTGQSKHAGPAYDYADVSKVVPRARMPAGVEKYPTIPGSNPIGQAKQTSPEYDYADVTKVVPRPRMPPGVDKAPPRPGGNQTSQSSNSGLVYDYADVSKSAPSPKMPRKATSAPKNGPSQPSPSPYAYAEISNDERKGRHQSEHLYAYADPQTIDMNHPQNGQTDSKTTEWEENTLYATSAKDAENGPLNPKHEDSVNSQQEKAKQENGHVIPPEKEARNSGTEGWAENDLYAKSTNVGSDSNKSVDGVAENDANGWKKNSIYQSVSDGV